MENVRSEALGQSATPSSLAPIAAAIVLGVALSGFFDGILLHQLLQWHHFLSLVQGAMFEDLRVQVVADGVFHVLMYLIALAGIFMLWRQGASSGGGGWRTLAAGLLLGFGGWNIADVGLFHWILGIHHIRVDTDSYLFWDVLWLVVLGLLPLAAGWWMRKPPAQGPSSAGHSSLPRAVITITVLLAGILPMLGRPAEMTAVLFRPGMDAGDVMAVVAELGGSWVAADGTGTLAVIKLPPEVSPWRLYRHGALMVGGAGPAGCLSFVRA